MNPSGLEFLGYSRGYEFFDLIKFLEHRSTGKPKTGKSRQTKLNDTFMKKTIQIGLYLMFASLILTLPAMAQNYDKELAALTKDYEKAYNKKDVKALVSMYTVDAVRDFSDGRHYSGAAEIEAAMVEEFATADFKVSIMRGKSETGPDGSIISTGTYHVTGKAGGEDVDMMGSYTNTVIMVDGKMKISKSSLVVNQ